MVKASELAELDDEELEGRLDEYRRELLNLRFQVATSQLDNTSRLSAVRKDIARVMTLIREREIALAEGRVLVPAIAHPRPVPHHHLDEEEEEASETEDAVVTAEPGASEDTGAEAEGEEDFEADDETEDEVYDEAGDEAGDETDDEEDV
jgi:large subunit ribosomal protein L29